MEQKITNDQASDYLSVIRELIKHENDLVNQRLSWMFTLHGLLFAASSFLWNTHILLIILFGIVGIISCISIGYTLTRGLNAIKDLLSSAQDFRKSLPDSMLLAPTIGSKHKAIEWLLPSRLFPWVLGIAWISIIIYRLNNFHS